MNMDHNNIDKLFKTGLTGYKPRAPIGAWDRLDSSLNGQKQKKAILIFRWAAASVLILLAFGAGYFFATYNQIQPQFTGNENPPIIETENYQPSEGMVENPDKTFKSETDGAASDQFKQNVNTDKIDRKVIIASHEHISDEQSDKTVANQNEPVDILEAEILVLPVIVMNDEDKIEVDADDVLIFDDIAITEGNTKETEINPEQDINWEDYYTPPTDSRALKWTIGAQFAPTYSYREISTNYSVGSIVDDVDNYNNSEESLLSYAGGVNVAYALNSSWSFNSGMYFSRIGQVSTDALEFSENKGDLVLSGIYTSSGIIDFTIDDLPAGVHKLNPPKDSITGIDPLNVKVVQNFDLFEVPFMMKYHILNKKFSVNLSGGLSPAYLVQNKNYLEFESNRYDIGSASNLNNFILNSTFGLGLGYQLTEKLLINFEPTFKYSLSPINSDSKVYYHPYYLSWFTGINYRF